MLERAEERRREGVLNAGIVASTVYNSSLARDPSSDLLRPTDFLPDEPPPEMTEEDLADQAAQFFDRLAKQTSRKKQGTN